MAEAEQAATKTRRTGKAGRRRLSGPTDGALLVFVHIPKTAGTTLARVLEAQYPEGGLRKTTNVFKGGGGIDPAPLARLREASAEILASTSALHAHLPLGIRQLLPAGTRYLTLLREPVERTLSHVHGMRSASDDAAASRSLEEVLADRSLLLDNLQTRMLSGVLEPFAEVTGEMLAQAKQNLASPSLTFGLTERFDESLVLIKQRLGWRSLVYRSQRVNDKRPHAAQLSSHELQAVERHNAHDLELYRFASELFARTIATQGRDFAIELAALRVALGAKLGEQARPALVGLDDEAWKALVTARAELLLREQELAGARQATAGLRALLDDTGEMISDLQQRAATIRKEMERGHKRASRPARPTKLAATSEGPPASPPPGQERRGGIEAALRWLDQELPVGTSQPAQALSTAAAAAGIAERTLRRARKRLAVRQSPARDGSWLWTRAAAARGERRRRGTAQ